MTEPEHVWRAVASAEDVNETTPLEVAVGNTAIILLRVEGDVAAYQGVCPHQFARLAGGVVRDGWLRCPHHMAEFNLSDGACGKGWTLPALKRYAVREEGGAVLLSDPPMAF